MLVVICPHLTIFALQYVGDTMFQYFFAMITSLQPSHTPQLGGEQILVHGVEFAPPDQSLTYCVFGSSGALHALASDLTTATSN